ncbi:MAG: Holliday junction resolvase RuvX [Alphaproteobacteria bacterium]|jgi:RNAse H domain protein, YqgF family|nr:putative Holliday junction resolvase [Acetobacter sp. CAG:267]
MNIKEFKTGLPVRKAVLGIDYGSKRMGLAVSDLSCTIATPYKILYRREISADMAELRKIMAEKEIGAVVMGLPLQMNGEEGEIAAEVRKFAAILEENFKFPVLLWDERLSSSAMENFLIKEADLSRKKRAKVLDASAAAYILQGALDALKYA